MRNQAPASPIRVRSNESQLATPWLDKFGNGHPRIFPPNSWLAVPGEIERRIEAFFSGQDQAGLYQFVWPFALHFLVSPTAMRIRLEKLGLIRREVPRPESLLARA